MSCECLSSPSSLVGGPLRISNLLTTWRRVQRFRMSRIGTCSNFVVVNLCNYRQQRIGTNSHVVMDQCPDHAVARHVLRARGRFQGAEEEGTSGVRRSVKQGECRCRQAGEFRVSRRADYAFARKCKVRDGRTLRAYGRCARDGESQFFRR